MANFAALWQVSFAPPPRYGPVPPPPHPHSNDIEIEFFVVIPVVQESFFYSLTLHYHFLDKSNFTRYKSSKWQNASGDKIKEISVTEPWWLSSLER